MTLDRTLAERNQLNTNIVEAINHASASASAAAAAAAAASATRFVCFDACMAARLHMCLHCDCVLCFFLGDVHPPARVIESMHQQVSAKRTKRARQPAIKVVEGQKEGKKQPKIPASETQKAEQINWAEGEARAILLCAEASAVGIGRVGPPRVAARACVSAPRPEPSQAKPSHHECAAGWKGLAAGRHVRLDSSLCPHTPLLLIALCALLGVRLGSSVEEAVARGPALLIRRTDAEQQSNSGDTQATAQSQNSGDAAIQITVMVDQPTMFVNEERVAAGECRPLNHGDKISVAMSDLIEDSSKSVDLAQ